MPKVSPVNWKVLAKFFEQKGWILDRVNGDHLVYVKIEHDRPVVIPKVREVQTFIILNNLKTAKISRDEYLKLLKK
ncbi:MAG: type II toxin-antitoxin system HicA family toxin [Candidatus Paceibacterota bacterium]|jgi:predicted RNA binding protein YcfA (HicA-like mRNA interferase family)